MSPNLCCQINPKVRCRDCNAPLCKEHADGISFQDLNWCKMCSDDKVDYINLIRNTTGRLEECIEEFNSTYGEWDAVVDHSQRCRICRGDSACSELYSLIDQASSIADRANRRIQKLRYR